MTARRNHSICEACSVTFSNGTEKLICIVIKLPGMDNTVINDDSTFQRIKAKYLEAKCHKHYSSVENMATAAAIQ